MLKWQLSKPCSVLHARNEEYKTDCIFVKWLYHHLLLQFSYTLLLFLSLFVLHKIIYITICKMIGTRFLHPPCHSLKLLVHFIIVPYVHNPGVQGRFYGLDLKRNGEQGLETLDDDTRSWLASTELETLARQQAHERSKELARQLKKRAWL